MRIIGAVPGARVRVLRGLGADPTDFAYIAPKRPAPAVETGPVPTTYTADEPIATVRPVVRVTGKPATSPKPVKPPVYPYINVPDIGPRVTIRVQAPIAYTTQITEEQQERARIAENERYYKMATERDNIAMAKARQEYARQYRQAFPTVAMYDARNQAHGLEKAEMDRIRRELSVGRATPRTPSPTYEETVSARQRERELRQYFPTVAMYEAKQKADAASSHTAQQERIAYNMRKQQEESLAKQKAALAAQVSQRKQASRVADEQRRNRILAENSDFLNEVLAVQGDRLAKVMPKLRQEAWRQLEADPASFMTPTEALAYGMNILGAREQAKKAILSGKYDNKIMMAALAEGIGGARKLGITKPSAVLDLIEGGAAGGKFGGAAAALPYLFSQGLESASAAVSSMSLPSASTSTFAASLPSLPSLPSFDFGGLEKRMTGSVAKMAQAFALMAMGNLPVLANQEIKSAGDARNLGTATIFEMLKMSKTPSKDPAVAAMRAEFEIPLRRAIAQATSTDTQTVSEEERRASNIQGGFLLQEILKRMQERAQQVAAQKVEAAFGAQGAAPSASVQVREISKDDYKRATAKLEREGYVATNDLIAQELGIPDGQPWKVAGQKSSAKMPAPKPLKPLASTPVKAPVVQAATAQVKTESRPVKVEMPKALPKPVAVAPTPVAKARPLDSASNKYVYDASEGLYWVPAGQTPPQGVKYSFLDSSRFSVGPTGKLECVAPG